MSDKEESAEGWTTLAEKVRNDLNDKIEVKEPDFILAFDEEAVRWLDEYIEQLRPRYSDYRGISENFGALFGQILVQQYGGHWQRDREGVWGVAFANHSMVYPIRKV